MKTIDEHEQEYHPHHPMRWWEAILLVLLGMLVNVLLMPLWAIVATYWREVLGIK